MNPSVLIYSLIYLCASICGCPDDDIIYSQATYEVPDLVKVQDNSRQYQVNDTLFFEINIPRNISISDTESIDVFTITSGSETAYMSLALYRITNFDIPQPVLLSSNEVLKFESEVNIFDNILGIVPAFQNDIYKARIGLILREPGSFYLSGFETELDNKVYANFQGSEGFSLLLITSIIDDNDLNRFAFTVE